MVQAGTAYDYDGGMDENAEPSWTNTIRDAIKDFVNAVAESSDQLASAAEKFAADSIHTIDHAASRAEQSASMSNEMAQIAQRAAEEARNAADSLKNAVAEASEQVRNEASEGAAIHLTQVQEAGERLRTDLQTNVDEVISRIVQATGSNHDAVSAAEAATNAAREAADRVQQSVATVEAAVAQAQRAADESRAAAERSENSAGMIGETLAAAQEAAEASRRSAEQAGAQSTLMGGEANLLLERLETDYELLTRLVRELHGRISTLSLPSMPQGGPATDQPTVEEAPAAEPVSSVETPTVDAVTAVDADVEAPAPPTSWSPWQHENSGWGIPTPEANAELEILPESETTHVPNVEEYDDAASWEAAAATSASEPEAIAEVPAEFEPYFRREFVGEPTIREDIPAPAASAEPELVPAAAIEAAADDLYIGTPAGEQEEAEAVEPTPAEGTIGGRVQLHVSPVPDFDRLLNLDGALGRISGVESVTLADFAQDAVTFHVEILGKKDTEQFTRELAEAAGLATTLVDVVDGRMTVRIN